MNKFEKMQRQKTIEMLDFLFPDRPKPLTDEEKRAFADGIRLMINGPSKMEIVIAIGKAIIGILVTIASIKWLLS